MLTTLKSGYYVGMDCGTARTEAVIADESGFVIGRGFAQGGNPHNANFDETHKTIMAAFRAAHADATTILRGKQIAHYEAMCVGLAGLDTPGDLRVVREKSAFIIEHVRHLFSKIIIVNDGLIGLRSGTNRTSGICLSASTGSSCFGLSPTGREAKAGGWGFFLGDQASGFAIGKAILKQVIKEMDGRTPPTQLTPAVLKRFSLSSAVDLIPWIYDPEHLPIQDIASLSQLADDASLSDCIELTQIITRSVQELLQSYDAVQRQLVFPPTFELPVVLVGGLFKMKGSYSDQVIRGILNRTPQANIVFPTRSPAEGAIALAIDNSVYPTLSGSSTSIIFNPDN